MCEDKDRKIKDLMHGLTQQKSETKMYMKRVKELELEVQRLRNELEDERNKRAAVENNIKLDSIKGDMVDGLKKTIER